MHFHIAIAVWGEKFIDQLCEVNLPTMLAPTNLGALPNVQRSRLVFFTRAGDELLLRHHPTLSRLGQSIDVHFKRIEPSEYPLAHLAQAAAHREAAHDAILDGAHLLVIGPDSLMANGTLARVARYAAAGKRAVMVSGLRLCEETAVPALRAILADPVEKERVMKPREMLRFGMQHFHPEVERYLYDSDIFSPVPIQCLWSLGERGLLQRAFHLHPLMIDTPHVNSAALDTLHSNTIDGDFVMRAFGNLSDIVVERDSDNIMMFSFTSRNDSLVELSANRANATLIRRTAYLSNVNTVHRYFFTQAIKLHTTDLDDDWERLEEDTGHLVTEALNVDVLELGKELGLCECKQEPPPSRIKLFFLVWAERTELAWNLWRQRQYKDLVRSLARWIAKVMRKFHMCSQHARVCLYGKRGCRSGAV